MPLVQRSATRYGFRATPQHHHVVGSGLRDGVPFSAKLLVSL